MARAYGSDYSFVPADPDTIAASLIEAYESDTGRTIQPASVDRLFIAWVADALTHFYANINYAANQNIPSRAEGANLDALGELFFKTSRPEATAASATVRFTISAAQASSVLVPSGTRVTTNDGSVVFATAADAYVAIGETTVDVSAKCTVNGSAGNGYAIGQINKLVDVFDYFSACSNTTASAGGADRASDDEYYQLMLASEQAYSTAGSRGAYEYWAKSVSTDIADVCVNSPSDGTINLYAIMADGTAATAETKSAILAACSADTVRPLTDSVSVEDPTAASYDITLTYYLPTGSNATELEAAVEAAVDEYVAWQSARMGRDINPSKLVALIMATGVKRVAITAPVYTVLSDGSDNTAPQLATLGTSTLTNGGFEDE